LDGCFSNRCVIEVSALKSNAALFESITAWGEQFGLVNIAIKSPVSPTHGSVFPERPPCMPLKLVDKGPANDAGQIVAHQPRGCEFLFGEHATPTGQIGKVEKVFSPSGVRRTQEFW
jgi:hypothetical protein